MTIKAFVCTQCGAPLPTDGRRRSVRCRFCNTLLRLDADVVKVEGFLRALAEIDSQSEQGRISLRVAGRRYRVLGRIGQGESSDVFAAEWARRVTEKVLIKVLRAEEDLDLSEREWGALNALHESRAQGAAQFIGSIPQPVARGPLTEGSGSGQMAAVHRWRSGFSHTLYDVMAAHPKGLDPRHVIWIWRRLLDVLGFAHNSGWLHGAVLPQHVVVHARDHGILLVGWSCAMALGSNQSPVAVSATEEAFYPERLLSDGVQNAGSDVVMSARLMNYLLGCDPRGALPATVPAPLARLVQDTARDDRGRASPSDAWELERRLVSVARQCFGSPTYVKLEMPGWP